MIYRNIESLIQKAVALNLIESADVIYTRNQVMNLLKLDSFPEEVGTIRDESIPDLLEKIVAYAVEHNLVSETISDKEILSANIMNCFVPRPSVVHSVFNQKYKESPVAATSYFYHLSENSNYIQTKQIAKNMKFKVDTAYGQMDITINLSKPEKDPEQIKRERALKQNHNYPKCLLCKENEGYTGRLGYPARANHRVIKIPLLGENWFFQYSPYAYYHEHSILFSEEHRHMKIDEHVFERLLTFTKNFPHYFIGSNADLPIVGGSILSHDHYQAGCYEFAMTRADAAFSFQLTAHPDIEASVLKWPMSVIRLKGTTLSSLSKAANDIFTTWQTYSDELADVVAFTNGTPHNTVTPIARHRNGIFEIDLVLRNNRTTDEHPLGLFHPHADVHHIKKENIGLIEVMGLAVLPPRLKTELTEIKKYLLGQPTEVKAYHQTWAEELKSKYGTLTNEDQAEEMLRQEVGKKFVKVLEDAGVFKEHQAFMRFIHAINQK
ncbi:UDP-glucose--hexose-1-phosphate uridylyltransferase [Bacillus changyiensis]|uniref:UDP-glucose--hexose-1-phosphate uridylyltransferase n=1 Tax=Bacillus changyiensis TaxID=3004103 RepID=UPI0022E96D4C|nr:UDP-glucose--hexose-1-phosphate uridylyltransferase [Bacillus changyiensis]MDA1476935.1 UDP-glucose--hexose-1-phosphate uridylyltransferase [Bacillus changyiensis]